MPMEIPTAPPPGAKRVEGRSGGSPEVEKPLRLRPNHDFYLMHHPSGFRLERTDRGWEVLPVLKDLVKVGGINAVVLTEAGPNTSAARARLRDNGWTVLENQDDYRVLYDVAGGIAHRLRWEAVDRFPDGEVEVTLDEKGWADYRRSLVERKIIPPPRPKVLAQLRRRLERRIGRRGAKLSIPAFREAQERDEDRLEGLADALVSTPVVVEDAEKEKPKGPRVRTQGRASGQTEPPLDPPVKPEAQS